jgi:XTP/dITP diphosphohydrolase
MGSWEARKKAEKGRTSALDGIAEPLSSLARAHKVISRARHHQVPVDLPDAPITGPEVGAEFLALVARAQASGIDPDQALRAAVRALESTVRATER